MILSSRKQHRTKVKKLFSTSLLMNKIWMKVKSLSSGVLLFLFSQILTTELNLLTLPNFLISNLFILYEKIYFLRRESYYWFCLDLVINLLSSDNEDEKEKVSSDLMDELASLKEIAHTLKKLPVADKTEKSEI